MGKGDKRTRRGKTFKSSFGNTRRRKRQAAPAEPVKAKKKTKK